MAGLEAETIRSALALAKRHGFDEVELRAGESRFAATLLSRGGSKSSGRTASQAPAPGGPTEVRSQNVGYAHLTEIAPGNAVKEGARLATIETLGIANDLVSPRAGVFKEFLVEDEAAVEFGQTVAILEAE